MKFIEISDGISIRKSDIEAIKKKEDMFSVVYTKNREYEASFPYITLLQLLETTSDSDMSAKVDQMTSSLKTLQANSQTFGG